MGTQPAVVKGVRQRRPSGDLDIDTLETTGNARTGAYNAKGKMKWVPERMDKRVCRGPDAVSGVKARLNQFKSLRKELWGENPLAFRCSGGHETPVTVSSKRTRHLDGYGFIQSQSPVIVGYLELRVGCSVASGQWVQRARD